MGIITKMRKEKAIWWEKSGNDGFGGYTFAAPVEIDVRWEDRAELFIDPNGEEQVSQSLVYVDRDIANGDWLKRGSIPSGGAPTSPIGEDGAYPVLQKRDTPKLNYTETLRERFL